MPDFIAELRRRGVIRAAAFYAGAGWLMVEGAAQIFPFFEVPNWVVRWIVVAVLLGFLPALVFSWFFEVSSQGFKLDVALSRPERAIPPEAVSGRPAMGSTLVLAGASVLLVLAALVAMTSLLVGRDSKTTAVDSASRQTIAVLPFSTFSKGDGDDLLAAGLQDAVLTSLAGVQGLKVISRTSVAEFKDATNRNLKDIGRQLGVGSVIEGSLQRQGQRILVQAQLVDANTDEHIWAHAYDLKIDDLFTVEVDLSQQVASAVQVELSPAERIALGTNVTANPAAYSLYVRAQQIMDDDLSKEMLDQAETLLNTALRTDPSFALAQYALSRNDLYRYFAGIDHSVDRLASAKSHLMEAQRLSPNLPEIHIGWGRYYFIGRQELAAAEIEFRKAVELVPNSAESVAALGTILQFRGQLAEAVIFQRRAIELNPLTTSLYRSLSVTFQLLRDYPSALATAEKGLTLDPSDLGLIKQRVAIDLSTGDVEKARGDSSTVDDPGLRANIAFASGELARTIEELERLPDAGLPDATSTDFSMSKLLAIGTTEWTEGDKEKAATTLSKAIEELRAVNTESPAKHAELALALASIGRVKDATQQLSEVDEASIEDPARKTGITYDALYTNLLLGQYPGAAESLQDLIRKPSLVSVAALRHDPFFLKLCDSHCQQTIGLPD